MYSHDEVIAALKKRRSDEMQGHPMLEAAPPLSETDVSHAEGNAPMPQPHDQVQPHDPMKETGHGYETEPEPTLATDGVKAAESIEGGKGEEARPHFHELLGSHNAPESTLRGKAMRAALKK